MNNERGFACIGLVSPKTAENVGGVLRAAVLRAILDHLAEEEGDRRSDSDAGACVLWYSISQQQSARDTQPLLTAVLIPLVPSARLADHIRFEPGDQLQCGGEPTGAGSGCGQQRVHRRQNLWSR